MDWDFLTKKYSDILLHDEVLKGIGDGWGQIVKELLGATKIYQDANIKNDNFRPVIFTSIQPTQGWLNIEFEGGDEVVKELANFSRTLSFKTCELCGKIGKLYCSDKWMHWSNKRTLCGSHAVELLYYRIS